MNIHNLKKNSISEKPPLGLGEENLNIDNVLRRGEKGDLAGVDWGH